MSATQTFNRPLCFCCRPDFQSIAIAGPERPAASSLSLTLTLVLALLISVAPDAGVVPANEITPLNDTQADLTLGDVVERIQKHLPARQKPAAYRLGTLVMKLSERHQLSPSLILSVLEMESSYRFHVVSKAGAVGLMQLMPATAREVARLYKIRAFRSTADLGNPEVNLKLGVAYLALLRRQFGHSIHYLAAYNLGPGAFRKRLKAGKYELGSLDTYVRRIHQRARELQGNRERRKFPEVLREEALLAYSF